MINALQVEGEEPTDFGSFLDADGTLYLCGKDSEVNSVAPLTTAMAEDLLERAEARAPAAPAERLDPAFLAALDEAPNYLGVVSARRRSAPAVGGCSRPL
ncbi:hypothetical protein ACIQJX_26565 [Streptomyces griseoviridis]|uniref:hypothetical protein n=1 Tax=Streptomyces griseoviridis TaxID=45398 RepID=UPI0019D174D3|nr:hypothetical protein [Streptomyces griseoviridis]